MNVTIEEAQRIIDRRDKMTELANTRNFKKLFTNGYFKDEAARLAGASTNPEMMDEIDQRELFSQLKAIGHMQNFILNIKREGDNMEAALKQHYEEELEAERRANIEVTIDPITGDEIEVKDDA